MYFDWRSRIGAPVGRWAGNQVGDVLQQNGYGAVAGLGGGLVNGMMNALLTGRHFNPMPVIGDWAGKQAGDYVGQQLGGGFYGGVGSGIAAGLLNGLINGKIDPGKIVGGALVNEGIKDGSTYLGQQIANLAGTSAAASTASSGYQAAMSSNASGFANAAGTIAANYLMGAPEDTGEATGRAIGGAVGSAFIPYIGGLLGSGIGDALGEIASGGEKTRNGHLEFGANPITKGILGDTNVYGAGRDVFGHFGLTDENYFGHKWDQTYNAFSNNLTSADNGIAQSLGLSADQIRQAQNSLSVLNGQSYYLGNNRDNGLQMSTRMLVDHYGAILGAVNPTIGKIMQTYTGSMSGMGSALQSAVQLASDYESGKVTDADLRSKYADALNTMFTASPQQAPWLIKSGGEFQINPEARSQSNNAVRWNGATNQVETGHMDNMMTGGGSDGGDGTPYWNADGAGLGNMGQYGGASLTDAGTAGLGSNFYNVALQDWQKTGQFQQWKQQQITQQKAAADQANAAYQSQGDCGD